LIGCETVASFAGERSDGAAGVGGGCGARGFTVKVALRVTPAPDTEMVTTVCVLTSVVKILNPPVVDPRGIIMPFGTDATAGLLLVTCSI
jgi:hypothetical protein